MNVARCPRHNQPRPCYLCGEGAETNFREEHNYHPKGTRDDVAPGVRSVVVEAGVSAPSESGESGAMMRQAGRRPRLMPTRVPLCARGQNGEKPDRESSPGKTVTAGRDRHHFNAESGGDGPAGNRIATKPERVGNWLITKVPSRNQSALCTFSGDGAMMVCAPSGDVRLRSAASTPEREPGVCKQLACKAQPRATGNLSPSCPPGAVGMRVETPKDRRESARLGNKPLMRNPRSLRGNTAPGTLF